MPAVCSIDGCDKNHVARGWCRKHYDRWHQTGEVTLRTRSVPERFMEKVEKDSCWLFRCGVLASGYTLFWDGERHVPAHRWSYEHFVGPIPEGLHLDHLCRVRNCVKPDHLEPVTPYENNMRSESVPAKNARKRECKRGHAFDPTNTYLTPDGRRQCRACMAIRAVRYERKRERACA